jgi:uncharacterized repeat protein (TIGR04076 family)
MGKDLKINIVEIKGTCPVYQKGDYFILKHGYILDQAQSCRVCMHSLASILPYHVALSHGVAPVTIGLNKKDKNRAYLQCLDPCAYTGGGTID